MGVSSSLVREAMVGEAATFEWGVSQVTDEPKHYC